MAQSECCSLRNPGRSELSSKEMARRYKPIEQPGEAPSKKSRIYLREGKDPDFLSLE